MIARSHDGTVAPSHVIARHTYADTMARVYAEVASMEQEAAEAYAAAVAELDPLPGEEFWIAVRHAAGWRVIYYDASPLTRPLAVRLARARRDPTVLEIAILRSLGEPARLAVKIRRFREVYHLASLQLAA